MLGFLVIQKQPPCYNALKLLTCSMVFTSTASLQSEGMEGFSALFYNPMLQNAEGHHPHPPARGAALWARWEAPCALRCTGAAHYLGAQVVWFSGGFLCFVFLALFKFWSEALSEPPAALCICHGKAGKSQGAWCEPGAMLAPSFV